MEKRVKRPQGPSLEKGDYNGGQIYISFFIFFSTSELTHTHTMTPFDSPGKQAPLKTLWEKEKLLVTSNLSFSHSVFYPFG